MSYSNIVTGNPETWDMGLITLGIITSIFGLILSIVSIIWFVTWIKWSWLNTTNSANLSGGQLSQFYLDKHGLNAKRISRRVEKKGGVNNINVVSKFWYTKPYSIKNNEFTLRLVPWTYKRTSLYTLSMAMESTWAVSSSKSKFFNSFIWEFGRRISLLVVFLPFIFGLIFVLAPYIGWNGFVDANTPAIATGLFILFSVLIIIYSVASSFFYGKSRKEICENLEGILSPNEIKVISWIYKIKFIYWILKSIYEILRFIMQIIILSSKK